MPHPEGDAALTFVPTEVVNALRGKSLFYPHSYKDVLSPIRNFAPQISDFWFADVNYPAWDGPCLATLARNFRFEGRDEVWFPKAPVSEAEARSRHWNWTPPHIYRENYTHVASGNSIRVNLCRGDSYETFCRETFKLGIFFYRGDSCEGSNHAWNAIDDETSGRYLGQVLDRLVDGGLVVTDGSRVHDGHFSYGQYSELARYMRRDAPSVVEAVQLALNFADHRGRRFTCVGYLSKKSHPTLIWQVRKPQYAHGQSTS